MIYITGDTHIPIDISKLNSTNFPEGSNLTKNDYVIILGDFGLLWNYKETNITIKSNPNDIYWTKEELYWKQWLDNKPWTTLFIDGNHENFNRLNSYPVETWNGGKVHKITNSIIHLMRGQIFNLENLTFFTFGGAESIDKLYRKENVSWWSQELPSYTDCEIALQTLENHNWKVDYILSHCAPDNIQYRINPIYKHDILTNLFFTIDKQLTFRHWYFGHYHLDKQIDDQHTAIYQSVIEL